MGSSRGARRGSAWQRGEVFIKYDDKRNETGKQRTKLLLTNFMFEEITSP
jgi:hypothetical protein